MSTRGEYVIPKSACLSISESDDLLGFFHTNITRVYRELSNKVEISIKWQFSWCKCLVDAGSQRRVARML